MILSASHFLGHMVSTMCLPLRTSHQLVRTLYSIRAKVRSVLTVDVGAIASTDASTSDDVDTAAASDDDGGGDPDPDSDPGCPLASRPASAMRICATLCAGVA